MDNTRSYRRQLTHRLLLVAGLLSAPMFGCDGDVVADGDGDGGSGASSNGGHGGAGGHGGDVMVTTTTTSGGNTWEGEECFTWPQNGTGGTGGGGGGMMCPSTEEAYQYTALMGCGYFASEGSYDNGQCCYDVVYEDCGVGRPFVADGHTVAAPIRSGNSLWLAASVVPCVYDLTREQRQLLADAWSRDGALEHASVASFGRFALELMAVGAPPALISAAHAAAMDEVKHAKACLALASAYAGTPLTPAAFPFHGSVEVSADLADIAARAVVEGCIGETLASIQAAEQLAVATDPAVRAVLAGIVEEEAQHAELAWRAVAWAIEQGGERVRAAVQRAGRHAIAQALQPDAVHFAPEDHSAMAAHGRIDSAPALVARRRAVHDVIHPCLQRLLQQRRPAQAA